MKHDAKQESGKLFSRLKWADDNTQKGQKPLEKVETEPTRVFIRKYTYRGIPFDFEGYVWKAKDGRIIRDARAEFDWFRGAFIFAMYLRGEMTDKETGFSYEVYEPLDEYAPKAGSLKEASRTGLEKTVKEIDWYLDEFSNDLPVEAFRFICKIRKLKKPALDGDEREKQIKQLERKSLDAWRIRAKDKAVLANLSYRGIPFVMAFFNEADLSDGPLWLMNVSVPGMELDKIPGLRFADEIYKRIYGDCRCNIVFSRKVPLEEKVHYGVFYVTRFIDWFLSCPEGDILSETAVILAEANKVVKSCPARLTCPRM